MFKLESLACRSALGEQVSAHCTADSDKYSYQLEPEQACRLFRCEYTNLSSKTFHLALFAHTCARSRWPKRSALRQFLRYKATTVMRFWPNDAENLGS